MTDQWVISSRSVGDQFMDPGLAAHNYNDNNKNYDDDDDDDSTQTLYNALSNHKRLV